MNTEQTIYLRSNVDARTAADIERYEEKLTDALQRFAAAHTARLVRDEPQVPALLLRQAS